MAIQRSSVKTQLPLLFRTLDGASLSAVIVHIELHYDDSGSAAGSCEMLLEVDGETCAAIVAQEWFHCFGSVRLNQATFEPGRPAELLVALRPAIVRGLISQGMDAEDVLDALLPSGESAKSSLSVQLKQTESWLALELKQLVQQPEEGDENGRLTISLRTNWREKTAHDPVRATPLYAQMQRYLEAKALIVEPVNDELMRLRFYTDEAEWGSVIQVEEAARTIVLYSVFPTAIPSALREETALAFIGENYGSTSGSYEMDIEDGELRYRTTIALGAGQDLDVGLAAAALSDHLEVMKRFVPVVSEVIEQSGH
ncbi:YbjN domain-containing protein [Paenibacillus sacheonensis]|uniref:YbjN domain-containing protein n=1 Tax=Paenibacillus sacheonensis TaxID=742054 RepID=A0A7X4YMY6_9BACL|nr:YbjN domain-containing protein [Paenibacillus sacheonensis]NBC68511.1 hypothetical protein [Paenibacillus sacheonensis]